MSPARVFEPLSESAPLAWTLAPRLCRVDPVTGENCAWEHGPWQYLRLLGLLTSPTLHQDFYHACLAELRPARVLISGSADYSMLAQAAAVLPNAEFTVVDRCETPLALNRWYAARAKTRISTWCGDVLEFQSDQPFDLVCTHAFFSYFPPARRPALVAAWCRVLRPGGAVVTVNRLRPRATETPAIFAPADVQTYRAAALQAAKRASPGLPIGPAVIADAAEQLARRQRSYGLRSTEDVRVLLESGGFTIARLDAQPLAAEQRTGITGPSAPGEANYALIMARRR
jgi:SAM-dependent methyltransferase